MTAQLASRSKKSVETHAEKRHGVGRSSLFACCALAVGCMVCCAAAFRISSHNFAPKYQIEQPKHYQVLGPPDESIFGSNILRDNALFTWAADKGGLVPNAAARRSARTDLEECRRPCIWTDLLL